MDKTKARLEFGSNNDEEYEVEVIYDSAVYARELGDYLPNLYNLVS